MKTKIMKVMGILLTASLVLSMFAVAAPVSAAPGENEWDTIGMPDLVEGSDVTVMDVGTDGTIYAAIYDYYATPDETWDIMKSTDNGYTWEPYVLSGLTHGVKDIEVAPDGTVYVATGCEGVWRIADGEATLLKQIVDSYGDTLEQYTYRIHSIDVWNDGTYNWILAATDLDVLVLKDALFEDWRDQEMATGGDKAYAFYAEFAPDFAESEVIWALASDDGTSTGDFMLTATVSPGQWGMTFDDLTFENQGGNNVDMYFWYDWIDIEFADNYDSETNPILYVALNGYSYEGNLFLVQADEAGGTSEADPLLPDDVDVSSVEVCGDVILVAERDDASGFLWRSTNAGDTFTAVDDYQRPAGSNMQIHMAPGFTEDEGVVYVGTRGDALYGSAFSISTDGGVTYNAISWIDLEIDDIMDVAFDGDTTYMLTEFNYGGSPSDIYGIWVSDNAAASDPVWELAWYKRQDLSGICLIPYSIEVALDGSAVFMFAYNYDSGDDEIWKSIDGKLNFSHWRDLPSGMSDINDWVIESSTTMYAATDGGFWGTSAFGPATIEDFDADLTPELNSVAVYGDVIAVGFTDYDDESGVGTGNSGSVAVSTDAGETWGDSIVVSALSDIYVAFGPDGTLYAASSASQVVVVDYEEGTFEALEDSTGGTATVTSFSGIWVSPDNAVYAIGGDILPTLTGESDASFTGGITLSDDFDASTYDVVLDGYDASMFTTNGAVTIDGSALVATSSTIVEGTIYLSQGGISTSVDVTFIGVSGFTAGEGVTITASTLETTGYSAGTSGTTAGDTDLFRILVTEHHSLWETAQNDGAMGLWGTQGSNILWTIVDGDELWAFEDTLVTAVELDSPETGAVVAGKTSTTVSWNEVDGATAYDLVYMPVGGSMATDKIAVYGIEATSYTITGLADNTEYCWMVRVTAPYNGKTSEARTFTTTDDVEAPVAAPDLMPINGAYNVPVKGPAFAWTFAGEQPDAYTWELSTDPLFGSTLATATLTVPYVVYDGTLDYETAYYWRVNAVTDAGGTSGWVTSVFTTAAEEMAPVEVDEQQPPVINLTVPDSETPGYIWAIIAIGALLTIAVIVLIVRTRRVV